MFIYQDIALSAARSATPELIKIISPFLNDAVFPFFIFLTSFLGSFSAITSSTGQLFTDFNNNTNRTERASMMMEESINQIRSLGLTTIEKMMNETGLCIQECPLAIACEIGAVTAENVPFAKYLVSKMLTNGTTDSRNVNLDGKEKVLIQALQDPSYCAKENFICDILSLLKSAFNKLQASGKITTTTTTTTTPPPLTERRSLRLKKIVNIIMDLIQDV